MSLGVNNTYELNNYNKTSNAEKASDIKTNSTSFTDKTDKSDSNADVNEYYNKLCSKFPNLKITIGNYHVGMIFRNGAEKNIGSNIRIDPKYLKKAAEDPKVAATLEDDLSGIPAAKAWLLGMCKMNNQKMVENGIGFDANGNSSSWGSMTCSKPSPNQKSGSSTKCTTTTNLMEDYRKKLQKEVQKLETLKEEQEKRNDQLDKMIKGDKTSVKSHNKLVNQYNNSLLKNININLFDKQV